MKATQETDRERDKLISSNYGNPRLKEKGLNPYERLPERDSWTESETRERADGTQYRLENPIHRWGGMTNAEGWRYVGEVEA